MIKEAGEVSFAFADLIWKMRSGRGHLSRVNKAPDVGHTWVLQKSDV